MNKYLSLLIVISFFQLGCEAINDESQLSVAEICGTEDNFSNPATFCQIQAGLLVPKCVRCHERGSNNIGSIGDYDALFDLGWVVANDLNNSTMFTRMEAGDITNTVITDEELDAVESWILDGAPNN